MTSTVGPPKTVVNANQFRSTNVYGSFNVMDNSSNSIQARAAFGRDVYIGGNLYLANGAVDASGAFLDSTSNIEFTLNKAMVAVPVTSLNYIKNCTSDIQTQLNTLSSKSTGSSSSTGLDVSGNITFTGSINSVGKGTLDYIKNVTSDIQAQINSSNTNITNINNKISYSIMDISWIPGTINATNIANNCNTKTLTFSNTLNNISTSTFGFLSGVTSSIQDQINNCNTAEYNLGYQINNTNNTLNSVELRTRDISWTYGAANVTTIANFCNTSYLSFSQSLNNISTITFGYLAGVTSSIQNQINALANRNPPGSVILFAGSASSLSGYLPCDGQIYNSQNYPNLYNAIGTLYGDGLNGNFSVPDYRGIFLRGLGTRFVAAKVVGGGGLPVGKYFTSPDLGHFVVDQSVETVVNNYSLNQQVKRFVTNGKQYIGPPDSNFDFSNAIASETLDITTNFVNQGYDETFPANTSVQYFIKY